MCGIVGLFGCDPDRRRDLASMLAAVRTRGETDEVWHGPNASVGTRRLKIVDRERAVQPIFNEDRSKLIIFNGEIFNFRALKATLEPKHRFATASDTETILHAYEEFGRDCVNRFDGQFAFVIYDLEQKTVFAARDHVGIVPLYYSRGPEGLLLASTVGALVPFGHPIHHVPPGHTLTTDCAMQAFYEPEYRGAPMSRADFTSDLKRAVRAAVKKRVDTDLPIGIIYSGGIDSSIVLNEALKHHSDVTAFTIGAEASEDFAVSRRFCAERGIRHITVEHSQKDITKESIKRTIRVTELNEYLDIINAAITLPLFERIHEEGIKVVLGGDGSDELFGGYHMYQSTPTEDEARLRIHNLLSLHRTELQRVDRCSMAHEVETRVPFLDLVVVDLALRMPSEWKQEGELEKWPVRQAFADELPDYVVRRGKNPLSYSSGLHEAARMYKPMFARTYSQFGYDLLAPMKKDFSQVLADSGYDLDRALEQDALMADYSRLELVAEMAKAGVRRYLLSRN